MRQPWICTNLHAAAPGDIGVTSEVGSGSHVACRGPEVRSALQTELWGTLPEDLIDRVVAFLPLPYIFQARLVCKKWNSLIYSWAFLRVHSRNISLQSAYFPLFISFSRQRECFGYNFVTSSWQKLPPLSFLPAHVTGAVKGAGGLLCFSYYSEVSGVVVHAVCNPLTKRWRNLPRMAHKRLRPLLNHMVVADKTTKAYKIVVADDDSCFVVPSQDRVFMTTEVYDSALDSWTFTSRVPYKLDSSGTSALCNGVIFCVAIEEDSGKQLGIISYNVEEGRWGDAPSKLSGNLCMTDLVECGGSVMVVADLFDNGLFVSVNIFRQQEAGWTYINQLLQILVIVMTKQKLPGWWQTSRQVQASADEAANHVTCLNYDVDRVPKLSEAQVLGTLDDDGGINCLLDAARGNADFTVLTNLHKPDYALCVEPFLPFKVVSQGGLNQRLQEVVQNAHRTAVPLPSATTDALGKSVTRRKQKRVSLQAPFAGSRMVWEGIASAARARRRPSDLVASPSPVPLAASSKLGDVPQAQPPATVQADDVDTDSSSCEDLRWVDGEDEFHRRFHEELNRKIELELRGHNGRSVYAPERKLKKKASLPHWHCSIEHDNRKNGAGHPYKCAETLQITSDRMSLGLGFESHLGGAFEVFGLPGASDSIPVGSDTFALVSEKCKDHDDSDDSSVSSCSTQHSGPSCKNLGVIFKRPTDAVPADKDRSSRSCRSGPAENPTREKKPGNMPAGPTPSRRLHPYLKPVSPKAARIPRKANKQQSVVTACNELILPSPLDLPSADELFQNAVAQSEIPALRPLKIPRASSIMAPPKVPAGSATRSAKLTQTQRLKPSLKAAAQKQDIPVREIRITPWNNQSPRPDFLIAPTRENAPDSAFCFKISLPGERCLQVKAEAEPNEVHISVSLQGPRGEPADKTSPDQAQPHSKCCFGSAVTKKKAFNVSWSSPEILCPNSCASLPESAPGQLTEPTVEHAHSTEELNESKKIPKLSQQEPGGVRACILEAVTQQVGSSHEHAKHNSVSVHVHGKPCPTPTQLVQEEEKAKPQASKLGDVKLRNPDAPLLGTSSTTGTTCILDTSATEGCVEAEPCRREKSDKRRGSKPETSLYSELHEMIEWQRSIAEYKQIKGSQPSQTQEDVGGSRATSKFTKSSQKSLDKLSRKSGSGDCLCSKAFKSYSEHGDLEEKENQLLQTCTRGCRLGLSTSKAKGNTWNIFSFTRCQKDPDKQPTSAKARHHSQSESTLAGTHTEQVSFVVGTKSRAGRKQWLGLFKKAIQDKSLQLKRNQEQLEQREQTPRPFSTGSSVY